MHHDAKIGLAINVPNDAGKQFNLKASSEGSGKVSF